MKFHVKIIQANQVSAQLKPNGDYDLYLPVEEFGGRTNLMTKEVMANYLRTYPTKLKILTGKDTYWKEIWVRE